jgi:dTDP-4-amino-4,6-dideoxygalactose transaminase
LPGGYRFYALGDEQTVVHLAVLDCPDRAAAIRHFGARGIKTDIHYPVLDNEQPASQALKMRVCDLSRARSAVSRVLTIPCFPQMSTAEIATVCSALKNLPVGIAQDAHSD